MAEALGAGAFSLAGSSIQTVVTLSAQQLNWLLDGYDVMRMKPHARLYYSSV